MGAAGLAGRGAPEGMRKFLGTCGRDVTEFILEGRRLLREHYAQRHAAGGDTARQNLFPLTLPSMPDFRTTRRIEGLATLADGDAERHFDDGVCLLADWRGGGGARRPVWEVSASGAWRRR